MSQLGKIIKLKEFGSNHTEFELTLKAFGKKPEFDTQETPETAVEETIVISKEIYSKIINMLEKIK